MITMRDITSTVLATIVLVTISAAAIVSIA